jgi:hypothetical protein
VFSFRYGLNSYILFRRAALPMLTSKFRSKVAPHINIKISPHAALPRLVTKFKIVYERCKTLLNFELRLQNIKQFIVEAYGRIRKASWTKFRVRIYSALRSKRCWLTACTSSSQKVVSSVHYRAPPGKLYAPWHVSSCKIKPRSEAVSLVIPLVYCYRHPTLQASKPLIAWKTD